MKAKGKPERRGPAAVAAPRNLRLATAGLAAVGLAVSIYLTVVHYTPVPLVCLGTTGCEAVNRSIYAVVAGVPVALLGAAAYAAVLAVLGAESQQIIKAEEAALAVFGLSLAGVLYSAYLTYVALFVLGATCIWCLISAVTIAAIFALAVVRLRAVIVAETQPVKGKAKQRR